MKLARVSEIAIDLEVRSQVEFSLHLVLLLHCLFVCVRAMVCVAILKVALGTCMFPVLCFFPCAGALGTSCWLFLCAGVCFQSIMNWLELSRRQMNYVT